MTEYWNEEWKDGDVNEYKNYINVNGKPKFFSIFEKNDVQYVCDAACGFGAFSAMLINKGYRVDGFDISENTIKLTKNVLHSFNLDYGEYKVCSLTDIKFANNTFDAVVAHAVMDHLSYIDADKALNELLRIVKTNGLVYMSFDCLEEDDIKLEHSILEDESFLYTDESRNGLLFKYYTNDDINKLVSGRKQIYFNTNSRGDREIILKKE